LQFFTAVIQVMVFLNFYTGRWRYLPTFWKNLLRPS